MAEGTVDAHLNTGLRLFVNRSLLLVSVRKDHELDRYLLEKKKQEFLAKKRKRGSADDPICQQFGDFGPEIFAGSTRQIRAPGASGDDSK